MNKHLRFLSAAGLCQANGRNNSNTDIIFVSGKRVSATVCDIIGMEIAWRVLVSFVLNRYFEEKIDQRIQTLSGNTSHETKFYWFSRRMFGCVISHAKIRSC